MRWLFVNEFRYRVKLSPACMPTCELSISQLMASVIISSLSAGTTVTEQIGQGCCQG